MQKQTATILGKINEIEKDLQSLKLELFLKWSPKEQREFEIYSEEDIVNEVRRVRKKFWNEKYSKAFQDIS